MVLTLDEDGKEPGMHTFNHMHMRKAFRIMNDLRRLVHAVKPGYVMFRVVKMCGVAALEESFSSVCVRREKATKRKETEWKINYLKMFSSKLTKRTLIKYQPC